MDKDIKLKKCPFCGGDAILWTSMTHMGSKLITAKCTICGASAKAQYYVSVLPDKSVFEDPTAADRAAAVWNERS